MKDRETLTKINRSKKLENKIELGNAVVEMITLQTDSDLIKYKIIYAIAKVMTEL